MIFTKEGIVFYALVFFLAGIVAGDFFIIPVLAIFCCWLAGLFLAIITKGEIRILAIFILALFLGLFRYQITRPDFSDPGKIHHYIGKQEITGVVKEIRLNRDWQNLIVEANGLSVGESVRPTKWLAVSGRLALTAGLWPRYLPGDFVRIKGNLKQLDLPPAGYGRQLYKQNIFVQADFAEVSKVKDSFSFRRLLQIISNRLKETINWSAPEPSASLLNGILLNRTEGMPKELTDKFSLLGLTHIIAISGSHLVIIMAILTELLIFFGCSRTRSFWPATSSLIFYVILVGAPASAVRSVIMAVVVLYAKQIGRLSESLNILLLTAAGMALLNPKIVLYDVGFQLSFLAVVGLAYFSPLLIRMFRGRLLPDSLKEILAATLSAQILTYPLLIFYFGNFSVYSLPANLLILPTVPFLMVLSISQLALGIFLSWPAQFLGLLSWLIIKYWLAVIDFFALFPGTQIKIEDFSSLVMLIFYMLIFGSCWLFKSAKKAW